MTSLHAQITAAPYKKSATRDEEDIVMAFSPKEHSIVFQGMAGVLPGARDPALARALSGLEKNSVLYWAPASSVAPSPYLIYHINRANGIDYFGRLNLEKFGHRRLALVPNAKLNTAAELRATLDADAGKHPIDIMPQYVINMMTTMCDTRGFIDRLRAARKADQRGPGKRQARAGSGPPSDLTKIFDPIHDDDNDDYW